MTAIVTLDFGSNEGSRAVIFQPWGNFTPRGHLAVSRDVLFVTPGSRGGGYWHPAGGGLGCFQHPALHGAALTAKN